MMIETEHRGWLIESRSYEANGNPALLCHAITKLTG
jgi:hypothetical protein